MSGKRGGLRASPPTATTTHASKIVGSAPSNEDAVALRAQLETALATADRTGRHAVAALTSQALHLLV